VDFINLGEIDKGKLKLLFAEIYNEALNMGDT
jgi:hypothetical protein